ncbi:MAG: hypothetical protein HYX60_09670 [Legionella longbeachae]|nr:hypothetical protein [Legionella longbeachae]
MNLIFKNLSALVLSFSAITAFASPPTHLITHNNTTEESNAFISGVPSIYPTAPISTNKVFWNLVRIACRQSQPRPDNKCEAVIKMAPYTEKQEIGKVTLDLLTGNITPKSLSKNGYTLIVNGLGEASINKN